MPTKQEGAWLSEKALRISALIAGVGSVAFWILFAPAVTFAQAPALPCGDIIKPQNPFDHYSGLTSIPIEDCDDPFARTIDPPSPYTLSVDGSSIVSGATVEVAEGGTSNFAISGTPTLTSYHLLYFLHDGDDYRFVPTNARSTPTEAEYRTFAGQFFPEGTDIEPYITAILSGDYTMPDQEQQDLLYDFLDYVDMNFAPETPKLKSGTYTLLITEDLLILSQRSLLETIFAFVIPTAHAQTFPEYRYTITFTLTETPPEPEGASSVLFLPGIQASRLYKDGILGTEDQLWEPNINNDVEALAMNEAGESVNEVYTRDALDQIFGLTNVYRSFLDMLEDLESEGVIAHSSAFAYDWRYDVADIATNGTRYEDEIKSLVSEIEQLATSSFTDKVTIIGHSNGGLVGKALLTELEAQGKADLVDKLVMVGTPQLGAPKAIAVMLHGYGQLQALGHVVDDDTARTVIRNMPGTYTLLPSAEYFEKVGETIVISDTSSTTASVRAYGNISTRQQLNDFVLDSQNRRSDTVPINEPSTLNSGLLQQSLVTGQALDEWLPPTDVDVYEIVGTGNPTIKAFEYQSFPCYVGLAVECATGTYMKAVPLFTNDGDETVTVLSASGQDQEKVTGYIDLALEGQQLLVRRREHMNLTESPAVKNFIDSIIKYPYLEPTLAVPEYTNVSRVYKVIGVHSPVSFSLTDSSGNEAGIVNGEIKEDINGSQYLELGDSKYVIVPDDISFTAKVTGEGIGKYSLTVDKLTDNAQTHLHRYIGASTTPTMLATFTFTNGTFSNVVTDLNGDGTTDITSTIDGQIIPPPVVYSYALLRTEIKALRLQKLLETALLLQVDAALHWDTLRPKKSVYQKLENTALDTLKATLTLYRKKGLITQAQLTALEVIINKLKN